MVLLGKNNQLIYINSNSKTLKILFLKTVLKKQQFLATNILQLRKRGLFLQQMSWLMRLWHLLPSVNSHAQPSNGATRLILHLLLYFMCVNSKGSGKIARMHSLAWAFAVRLCSKYHNLMSWFKYWKNKAIVHFRGGGGGGRGAHPNYMLFRYCGFMKQL